MMITLSKLQNDELIKISNQEFEWENIFFVKDQIKNKELKKFFFEIEEKKINSSFEFQSDINLVIDNDQYFLLKIEDDCPYLEEL